MTDNIDHKLICAYSMEISDRAKLILKLVPAKDDVLLKHLAAVSIHMTFFIRDIAYNFHGKSIDCLDKLEKAFTAECGCDIEGNVKKYTGE